MGVMEAGSLMAVLLPFHCFLATIRLRYFLRYRMQITGCKSQERKKLKHRMDQSSCPSQASPNFFHHTASKIATPYDAPTTGHAVAPAHFAVPRQHSTWLLSRTADRTSKSILRWRSGARLPRAPERPPPAATPGPQRLRRAQHPRRGALAPGGSAALHGLDRRRRLESGRAARGNTGPRTWERGSATTFQVINGTDGQS